jgi:hypothetical protein
MQDTGWHLQGAIMKAIASALVKAQSQFAPAIKTSVNSHFRNRYANLEACVTAVIDALNSNGIFLHQATHTDDSGVTVETIFLHESGEMLSGGKLHVPAPKHDPQGYGSALSYARRYSLMTACGIAPEDDDGNAASRPQQAPKAVAADAELVASSKAAASGGKAHFGEYWKGLSAQQRDALKPHLPELKALAEEVA